MLATAPEWLSAEDIAAHLECSVRTARRRLLGWFADGTVTVKREATDSRKWRYLAERASLAAYLLGEPLARAA